MYTYDVKLFEGIKKSDDAKMFAAGQIISAIPLSDTDARNRFYDDLKGAKPKSCHGAVKLLYVSDDKITKQVDSGSMSIGADQLRSKFVRKFYRHNGKKTEQMVVGINIINMNNELRWAIVHQELDTRNQFTTPMDEFFAQHTQFKHESQEDK